MCGQRQAAQRQRSAYAKRCNSSSSSSTQMRARAITHTHTHTHTHDTHTRAHTHTRTHNHTAHNRKKSYIVRPSSATGCPVLVNTAHKRDNKKWRGSKKQRSRVDKRRNLASIQYSIKNNLNELYSRLSCAARRPQQQANESKAKRKLRVRLVWPPLAHFVRYLYLAAAARRSRSAVHAAPFTLAVSYTSSHKHTQDTHAHIYHTVASYFSVPTSRQKRVR